VERSFFLNPADPILMETKGGHGVKQASFESIEKEILTG